MQNGGYPANVKELLEGLESDLRPNTLATVPRDLDIEANRRRRVDGPNAIPMPYGLQDFTPPPPERPIGGDQVFYTPEEQRFREYSRPGGGRDQMKEQMGEVAAGFVPGLGDAMEIGYIGRDAAAGDYDAAGLGALLMLLPGAMGKYGVDAYQKLRAALPDRKRTQAINDVLKNYMTRLTPFQRGLREQEMQKGRQTVSRFIDETNDSQTRLNRARTAKPLTAYNNMPADLVSDSRILDESIPLAQRKQMIYERASMQPDYPMLKEQLDEMSDADFMEMIEATRRGEDAQEMLLGEYRNFTGIPEDVLSLAASRRGGMPLDEYVRRLAGNPDPSLPISPEEQRQFLRFLDEKGADDLDTDLLMQVMKYQEKNAGKLPSEEIIKNLESILRRQRLGVAPYQLEFNSRNAPLLNEKGGKIPYKIIKR